MQMTMREILKPVLATALALRTQLHAALSIPLIDAAQFDESDVASSDSIESFGVSASRGKSFRCVDDHPGYLTGNGLGSLEIGAAHDD